MELEIAELVVPAEYMVVVVILLFVGVVLEHFVKPALECTKLLFQFYSWVASSFHRKAKRRPDSLLAGSAEEDDERTLTPAEYFGWAKKRQQTHQSPRRGDK